MRSAAVRHEVPATIIDPFLYAEVDGRVYLTASSIERTIVDFDFPLGVAERLRADGIELTVRDELFTNRRRAKGEAELAGIRRAHGPGVTGAELHALCCDVFEEAGYRTQRTGPGDDPAEGFQFSLGHGVGLEVHEGPALGQAGHSPLVAGDVLAIEPGLWDREVGGVRFEDLLLVTDDGCETLTDYPYDLAP